MEHGQSIIQSQSQALHLTSQMQQSLKVLQCRSEELWELVESELLENPTLESIEVEQKSDTEAEASQDPSDSSKDSGLEYSYEILKDDSYIGTSTSRSDEESSWEERIADNEESLAEHLMSQLRERDLTDKEFAIASYIIWNLNEDGYLVITVDEIARSLAIEIPTVLEVLATVQSLEPVGVAARNLQECLTIQLESNGIVDQFCARLLTTHAKSLSNGNLSEIASREDVSLEEVRKSLSILRKLNPFPGRAFNNDKPQYLAPDVTIENISGEYVPTVNSAGLPKLRVSRSYQELVRNGGELSTGDKQFLRGKIRSASWLVRCIYQREQTLLKVATAIVKKQKEFFDRGVEALKPLSLREIGEEIGLHESTISRASANKVMETPRGLFEFKYFFNSGVKNQAGEASASAVKERIKTIIREEDVRRPKSDEQIMKLLREFDIVVARRTVGKYREALGIESASVRREQYKGGDTGQRYHHVPNRAQIEHSSHY